MPPGIYLPSIKPGDRFGRLTVLEEGARVGTHRTWHCVCDCGQKCHVQQQHLRDGHTTSCGCVCRERLAERSRVMNRKHGLAVNDHNAPMYVRWIQMLSRCYNPKHHAYHNYGARGIRVCAAWRKSPLAFIKDVGYPPFEEATLDRIDNNGNYTPTNVRWATRREQSNNTRFNHRIQANGKCHTLTEWSEITGVNKATLRSRLERGWSPERAISRGET